MKSLGARVAGSVNSILVGQPEQNPRRTATRTKRNLNTLHRYLSISRALEAMEGLEPSTLSFADRGHLPGDTAS